MAVPFPTITTLAQAIQYAKDAQVSARTKCPGSISAYAQAESAMALLRPLSIMNEPQAVAGAKQQILTARAVCCKEMGGTLTGGTKDNPRCLVPAKLPGKPPVIVPTAGELRAGVGTSWITWALIGAGAYLGYRYLRKPARRTYKRVRRRVRRRRRRRRR